jgi:putative ABC transport system ATP-binding protein
MYSLQGIHLDHAFGSGAARTVVLHDVALGLVAGQVSLVMGPSGSGKSTLLAVLSGLLRPDGGRVLALDEDVWKMSDRALRSFRLRHFSFIFQGVNLFPVLRAREQLEMILRWGEGLRYGDARRRAGELLAMLGLEAKADLLPAQLSGGEKQRVAIGRALIKRPAFVFADEPTSALDWEHGKQVVELLAHTAHRDGATVLVVSHDPRIAAYADRIFRLDDGVLTEAGAATEPQLKEVT